MSFNNNKNNNDDEQRVNDRLIAHEVFDDNSDDEESVTGNDEEDVGILGSTVMPTTSGDDQYEEDGAIFRSVDILPQSNLMSTAHMMFGAASLTDMANPSHAAPRHGVRPELFNTTGSIVERSNWKVSKTAKMPTVPLFYPLERTHVLIPLSEMNVQVVVALISNLAQRLSLACDYESDHQAYLTADDGTLVSIQLFLDEDELGDDSTILEVQRRSGKSQTFFYIANKMLQVSKGIEHVEQMDVSVGKPVGRSIPPLKIPDDLVEVLKSSEEEEMENARSTLDMASNLLRSELSDSQELGLKLLEVLTDASRSTVVSCRLASKAVLTSNDFGYLMRDFLYKDFTDSLTYYEDDLVSSHSDVLKKAVLQILANALSVCVNEGLSLKEGAWLDGSKQTLISKLVGIVEVANTRPHEALIAMRCLEGMLLLFPETRSQAIDLDLPRVVLQAKLVGECSHANLYMESERVVGRMTEAGLISA
jgi:hypothetical protein